MPISFLFNKFSDYYSKLKAQEYNTILLKRRFLLNKRLRRKLDICFHPSEEDNNTESGSHWERPHLTHVNLKMTCDNVWLVFSVNELLGKLSTDFLHVTVCLLDTLNRSIVTITLNRCFNKLLGKLYTESSCMRMCSLHTLDQIRRRMWNNKLTGRSSGGLICTDTVTITPLSSAWIRCCVNFTQSLHVWKCVSFTHQIQVQRGCGVEKRQEEEVEGFFSQIPALLQALSSIDPKRQGGCNASVWALFLTSASVPPKLSSGV